MEPKENGGAAEQQHSTGQEEEEEEEEEETTVAVSKNHYPDGLNANFLDDNEKALEAKYGAKTGQFENPETRDIARNVPAIMEALGELKGLVIADVGAGTGLFSKALDEAVGADGKVFALEISPGFLKLLRDLVARERLGRTEVLGATHTDTNLPAGVRVDLALLIDVYHHVEKPITYMRKLRAQMAPGGRLVVIDFHRDPKKIWSHPPEWVLEHVRAGQDVFTAEIQQAGFALETEVVIEAMQENYMLVFRNPQ